MALRAAKPVPGWRKFGSPERASQPQATADAGFNRRQAV